jgi:hypothetical protein
MLPTFSVWGGWRVGRPVCCEAEATQQTVRIAAVMSAHLNVELILSILSWKLLSFQGGQYTVWSNPQTSADSNAISGTFSKSAQIQDHVSFIGAAALPAYSARFAAPFLKAEFLVQPSGFICDITDCEVYLLHALPGASFLDCSTQQHLARSIPLIPGRNVHAPDQRFVPQLFLCLSATLFLLLKHPRRQSRLSKIGRFR